MLAEWYLLVGKQRRRLCVGRLLLLGFELKAWEGVFVV